jgi:hypothetical protein
MKAYFTFLMLIAAVVSYAQSIVPRPSQVLMKFYDGTDWGFTANRSIRMEYTYIDSLVDYGISKKWDGTAFVLDSTCIKMQYFYNGSNQISHMVTTFWNGNAYVQTSFSNKIEYYQTGNRTDSIIVKWWDEVSNPKLPNARPP